MTYDELLNAALNVIRAKFLKKHGPPCQGCKGEGRVWHIGDTWGDMLFDCDGCNGTGWPGTKPPEPKSCGRDEPLGRDFVLDNYGYDGYYEDDGDWIEPGDWV